MGKIRVAIVGVGNCASSLVQGVESYKDAKEDEFIPGLMHVRLGGYHVRDVTFTAAFDIDKNKVGKDLAEAIYTKPNNTIKFSNVPKLGVEVQRGMTHDGLGKYLSKVIEKHPSHTVDVSHVLKETKTNIVLNYLPVGSEFATKWYVEQALDLGCAVVNCIPALLRGRSVGSKCLKTRPSNNRRRHKVTGRRNNCSQGSYSTVQGPWGQT